MTRHIFPTDEIAHLWASRAQSDARSRNNFSFRGADLFSYSTCIASLVVIDGGTVALFRESMRHYSSNTSRHFSMAQDAASHLPRFYVTELNVSTAAGIDSAPHMQNLERYADAIAELEGKAKRARRYTAQYASDAIDIQQEANRYCQTFHLADAYDVRVVDQYKAQCQSERDFRLQQEREISARRDADTRARMADDVIVWRAGDDISLWNYPDTLLRVSNEPKFLEGYYGMRASGDATVETSRGARVTIADAERLYRAIVTRTAKTDDRIGPYRFTGIDGDCVRIGCHCIKWGEVERLAVSQGWTVA